MFRHLENTSKEMKAAMYRKMPKIKEWWPVCATIHTIPRQLKLIAKFLKYKKVRRSQYGYVRDVPVREREGLFVGFRSQQKPVRV